MEQIKDQHRLIEKLFISPSSENSSRLMLSMQFLKLILDQAQQLVLPAQKVLMIELLKLFEKQPANSLLLYKHDELLPDQTPLLCLLIHSIARVIKTKQEVTPNIMKIDEFTHYLQPLISVYPIGLLHISSITRQLSLQFHQGSFNSTRAKFYHTILEKYYGVKQMLDASPLAYFFFYGPNQNSMIQNPDNTKITIKGDFSIIITFKLLEKLEESINLVWLATNYESLAFRVGEKVGICNQTSGHQLMDDQPIKENQWHCLIFNIGLSETSVYLNGQEIIKQKKGLIKKQKDRQIREYTIGSKFVGFISNFFILDKLVPIEPFKDFPSLQRWKQVIHLNENKLQSSVVVSCLPFSIFEMREASNCFDVFRKSHSIIGDNIIIFQNPIGPLGIAYLGNYEVLLPLFYLARFYSGKEYPEQLEKLLKIWLVALENFKDPENLDEFFIILGHHLEALPQLLTDGCVNNLALIYEKLNASNRIRFLRHVGWSGLPGKSNGQSVNSWLNWLTKLYQNNKSECLRSYGLMDVVFWLVKYLENNQQHCCPQHYVNQARALREFSFDELRKIEESTKKMHFQAVENIAAVILEYAIIDHPDQAVRSVKGVLRLLLHKYSNCLYYTILKILKRQIFKFRNDKEVSGILLSANILPFLAALAQKVVDHTLLSLILYLMLFVSQFQQNSRSEIVEFFSIVFRRLKEIHHQHFNLLSHGAKKVRKRSLDDTATTQSSITNILERLKQYRTNFGEMKYLLINCCLGVVDDLQISQQTKFIDDKGFIMIRNFLPLADKSLRRDIIDHLYFKMLQHPANTEFCQNSIQFTKLLLELLDEQPGRQIFTEIIQHQLKKRTNIGEYYISIKNISRSQIKTAELLCSTFSRLFIKHFKFTLTQFYQILLIMTNQMRDQEEPEGYWTLMAEINRNIAVTIKYHLLTYTNITIQTNGLELVEKIKVLDAAVVNGTQFQLEIYSVCEEEVNFLFDILLPKLIAGINISYLLQDIKRTVYVFQIFIYQLMRTIETYTQHKHQLTAHLVQSVIIFISSSIIRPEQEIDKSFLRMVLFLTSHFLIKHNEIKQLSIIWKFIISFIRQFASRVEVKSYAQMRSALQKEGIQPFFVEIFDIFLRLNNEDFVITFEDLSNADNDSATIITDKLIPVLQNEAFQSILTACRQNALEKVHKKYQESIISQQAKWDMQVKSGKQHSLFQAVEKIFQQESIGEQETRLKYLHQHQNYLRQYHSTWNEIWKRMRSYHHPYGIFGAQKNKINEFLFHADLFKNYRFRTSKYSSASGIQPILEVEILEPWHVRKIMQQENKNQLNNLVELMRPNQAKRKKTTGVMDSFTSFLKRIGGEKGPKGYTEYEVLWIKQGRKARGKLTINDRQQIVFWYESLKQADSHLAFQKFSLLFNETMVKSWRIDLIRKIAQRRYLMRYSALEIVLHSRKSLLFYFEENRHEEFLQELHKIRALKLQAKGTKLRLNKVPFYMDDWYQDGMSAKITEDWRNRKISTLEYLIAVNGAASRGIYDISQYPVFPWVCEMKDQKQPTLRDLTKTMGGLGCADRKRIVAEKYASSDPFNPVPPFHFGTHYSSPGVVFNFLIRLAPFTDYCKNLQGGKFDIPDRLFASLTQAWKSASTEVSDVRELIPQFYYLPEGLLNLERLHLGQTQSGEVVDHVELPPWAASNPYFFIAQMRQILQSQDCASTINNWIDLLFGIKQRGEAAKTNYNIYYYLTYEDYSDMLNETTDQVYRKSCEAQIVHFGQIPPQIFEKQHPKRIFKANEPVQLRISQKIMLMNNLKESLLGIHRIGNQLTLIKRNFIEILSLAKSPAGLTRNIQFNFEKTISKTLYGIKREQARIVFFRHYFIAYGYITNQFRIINKITGTIEFDESLSSRIEHIHVSQDESMILIGCRSGMLYIYQIEYDTKIGIKKVYTQSFMHAISHISENDGFYAVSFGCYVSIYKFQRSLHYLSSDSTRPFVRFFRSFHNTHPVKGAFIADIPLYCLVLFDKANIKIYSINGQLMKVLSSCNPKKMYALKDKQLNSLFCVIEEGRLLLLSTPDLRCISELEVGGALQIFDDMVVYEKYIHIISC